MFARAALPQVCSCISEAQDGMAAASWDIFSQESQKFPEGQVETSYASRGLCLELAH